MGAKHRMMVMMQAVGPHTQTDECVKKPMSLPAFGQKIEMHLGGVHNVNIKFCTITPSTASTCDLGSSPFWAVLFAHYERQAALFNPAVQSYVEMFHQTYKLDLPERFEMCNRVS
jgi:hypothetical protein